MENNEFERIKNTVKILSEANKISKHIEITGNALPKILGLKLTNRCNLRCKHCYEWNENGYHHNLDKDFASSDLNFDLIEKCLEEMKDNIPELYLWGGEPLIYYEIRKLLELLIKYDPIMAICTNGHLLVEHIDLLKQYSSNLELVIALEGSEKNNDLLRGKGSFKRTINAIEEISNLKKKGEFFAKITVHTMISNGNYSEIIEFIRFMEQSGVENLILCFPWYISEHCSMEMENYYNDNFDWLKSDINQNHSWNAFKYHILKENQQSVVDLIRNIRELKFKINLKIQPNLDEKYITEFLNGTSNINSGFSKCLSLYSRMDILPNGKVTSCKHFPEFIVGDLNTQSVNEIWTSYEMNKVREIYHKKKSPACSKCNNFYLHGYKKEQNK